MKSFVTLSELSSLTFCLSFNEVFSLLYFDSLFFNFLRSSLF
ncbi:CLUMA_CG010962, isoform A [Clunio marinus]|uniref:CLUMA_CG010962, isoform A n=1 Tax=Clunio marinus TaxID=568069 RepID=A0A1J1IBG5_9DIPT|nr:CLUMA_CG010962, isoform A [Clunio marinus]